MEFLKTAILLTAAIFGVSVPHEEKEDHNNSGPIQWVTPGLNKSQIENRAIYDTYPIFWKYANNGFQVQKRYEETGPPSAPNSRNVQVTLPNRRPTEYKVVNMFLHTLRTVVASAPAMNMAICNFTPLCTSSLEDLGLPSSRV